MPAPYSPSTIVSTARTDGQAWATGGSPITCNMEIPAGSPPPNRKSEWLDFTGFFTAPNVPDTIPAGMTAFVTVSVSRYGTGMAAVSDDQVYQLVSGTPDGTDAALAGSWPGSSGTVTYTFLCTPAQVNSNTFGFRLAAQLASGSAGDIGIANVGTVTVTSVTSSFTDLAFMQGPDVSSFPPARISRNSMIPY